MTSTEAGRGRPRNLARHNGGDGVFRAIPVEEPARWAMALLEQRNAGQLTGLTFGLDVLVPDGHTRTGPEATLRARWAAADGTAEEITHDLPIGAALGVLAMVGQVVRGRRADARTAEIAQTLAREAFRP